MSLKLSGVKNCSPSLTRAAASLTFSSREALNKYQQMKTASTHSAADAEIGRKYPCYGAFRPPSHPISCSSGAPSLRRSQQMVSSHEQIRQRRYDEQPVAILHHTAIADLGKTKDTLDDQESVFDLGTHTRLSTVLFPLPFGEPLVAEPLLIGKVAGFWRSLGVKFFLAGEGRVAVPPPLVAVQQLRERVFVVFVGGCRNNRMDQLGLAVHADVRLHAEVPLVALLGLAHLRVARLALVLGRGRGIDNRRVDDGAGRNLHSLVLEMSTDFLKQTLAQLMLFQQMAEFAHRGFIRRAYPSQINAHEFAHGQRVIERLFHRGVGKVEPVLDKVDAQHALKANRRASVSCFGVNRFDQGAQGSPWHNAIHVRQERSASRRLGITVKAASRECCLFHRSNPFVRSSLPTL